MFVEFQGWKLFYNKSGNGQQFLLLFHGFGQTHSAFDKLVNALSHQYTCFSFDLFFHGKSIAPNDESLTPELWDKIFKLFLQKEGIIKFSLAGYSLGGKYVLSILNKNPTMINEIIFIAPDGIKTNIWYSLATYPYLIRRFFKSMIRHPQRLYFLARLIHKLGLIDKGLLRFVESQMKTPTQRARVYDTWVGMRHIKFKTYEIVDVLIKKNEIKTTLFLGKYDRVIPIRSFINFSENIPSCKLIELDCGHNDLISSVASYYSNK